MKINLDPNKANALAKLLGIGGAGVEALNELFASAIAELSDVRNIDSKGNMGLQALAAQKAVVALQEVMGHCFPEQMVARTGDQREGQSRQYR